MEPGSRQEATLGFCARHRSYPHQTRDTAQGRSSRGGNMTIMGVNLDQPGTTGSPKPGQCAVLRTAGDGAWLFHLHNDRAPPGTITRPTRDLEEAQRAGDTVDRGVRVVTERVLIADDKWHSGLDAACIKLGLAFPVRSGAGVQVHAAREPCTSRGRKCRPITPPTLRPTAGCRYQMFADRAIFPIEHTGGRNTGTWTVHDDVKRQGPGLPPDPSTSGAAGRDRRLPLPSLVTYVSAYAPTGLLRGRCGQRHTVRWFRSSKLPGRPAEQGLAFIREVGRLNLGNAMGS